MPIPLFDAVDLVGSRIALARHLILFVDFDGTLAAVAEEPALGRLSAHMERVVRSLAEHDNLSLAIISGRERADLQTRIGIPGLIYAGNHGLEIQGHGFIFIEPTAAEGSQAIKDLAVELDQKLHAIEGSLVEDKGLTVSVHFRLVSEAAVEEVRKVVHGVLAGNNHPFQLMTGDKVYEIRPRLYWNKGTAVSWIQQQLDKPGALAIYLGGEAADEEAFAVLPDGITVRVGNTPETAAQFLLEGPPEVRKFLEWLDGLLRQPLRK